MVQLNNQKSARNVSADRIQMMDKVAERQLLINQNQLLALGRS